MQARQHRHLAVRLADDDREVFGAAVVRTEGHDPRVFAVLQRNARFAHRDKVLRLKLVVGDDRFAFDPLPAGGLRPGGRVVRNRCPDNRRQQPGDFAELDGGGDRALRRCDVGHDARRRQLLGLGLRIDQRPDERGREGGLARQFDRRDARIAERQNRGASSGHSDPQRPQPGAIEKRQRPGIHGFGGARQNPAAGPADHHGATPTHLGHGPGDALQGGLILRLIGQGFRNEAVHGVPI